MAATEDFKVEVARGRYPFFDTEHKFGHNANVGVIPETIWSEGGRYQYLKTAASLTISSADARDNSSGVGAQACAVYGLDENYNEVRELVRMAGHTPVTIPTKLLRVFRIRVYTAGQEGDNQGIIYVGSGAITNGKPANVYASVEEGKNQTLMATWTVPAGYDAYVERVYFSVGSGFDMECELYAGCVSKNRPMSVRYSTTVSGNNGGVQFNYPLYFCEKSDIELRGSVLSGGVHADGGFEVLMVKHGTANNWSGS